MISLHLIARIHDHQYSFLIRDERQNAAPVYRRSRAQISHTDLLATSVEIRIDRFFALNFVKAAKRLF